jgi:Cof subfamily protein (haloacid dehalogenase superfamily)
LELPAKNSYIISLNGSNIFDIENEITIFEDNLDKSVNLKAAEIFLSRCRQGEVEIIIYIDEENILAQSHSITADDYAKICHLNVSYTNDIMADAIAMENITKVIFSGKRHCLEDFCKELSVGLGDKIEIFFSSEFLLEFGSTDCNKGSAIKWLSSKLNINLNQVIAIGDNHNDLQMLTAAGLGVAVEGAVQAAKNAADYTTKKTAPQGAVAEVIEKFLPRVCRQ